MNVKKSNPSLRPAKVVTSAISVIWKHAVDRPCSPFFEQVITNLVKMVKARDIRRPFCPSGHWLSEEVNIRADKVTQRKPFYVASFDAICDYRGCQTCSAMFICRSLSSTSRPLGTCGEQEGWVASGLCSPPSTVVSFKSANYDLEDVKLHMGADFNLKIEFFFNTSSCSVFFFLLF